MLKKYKLLIIITILIIITLFGIKKSPCANATPAPPVSGIEVAEIWSDGSPQPIFPPLYLNELPDNISFRGTRLYIKTRFQGYPTWSLVFYRAGSREGSLYSYEELSKSPIGKPLVTGWEQIIAIPFNQLGEYNVIAVNAASSTNSGVEYITIVSNIRVVK